MDQLERTVVQLWEAKRLAAWGDIAHGRLALLLLDNAAEMSLVRTAQASLVYAEMYNNMAYLVRDVEPNDASGQDVKMKIEARTTSKRRKRQIERNFDALVDYVFEDEDLDLPFEFAECLKILHRYRNAAYHRDTVRADVLGPAVQILFFLCCHLLKSERQVFHEVNVVPDAILDVFGDDPPESSWPGNSFDTSTLAQRVTDRLLEEFEFDHRGIAEALSDHLMARMTALVRDLDAIGESVPPGITRWATLRLVQQAPRERADFDADLPGDFWTRPLPVTEEVLETWVVKVERLREISTAYDALRVFAEIEEPLEIIEEPVGRFLEDLHRIDQERIDETRDK